MKYSTPLALALTQEYLNKIYLLWHTLEPLLIIGWKDPGWTYEELRWNLEHPVALGPQSQMCVEKIHPLELIGLSVYQCDTGKLSFYTLFEIQLFNQKDNNR